MPTRSIAARPALPSSKWRLLLLAVALLGIPLPAAWSKEPAPVTFEVALSRYRKTTQWPQRMRLEATLIVKRSGGPIKGNNILDAPPPG